MYLSADKALGICIFAAQKVTYKMKKFPLFLLSIAFLSACNNTTKQAEVETEVEAETEEVVQEPEYAVYGETITEEGAVEASELYAMMEGKDSLALKVKGTINESCKKKGCWMKMDMGNGDEMRVTFKDYGFFVPTDLNGQTAIIEGFATMDTTDVETLRHYAEDGGQSAEEIAAITEPEISLNYEATGVIIL